MWPAVRAELRLPGTRMRVGLAAAVVAVAALVLMPINGFLGGSTDPQSAEQLYFDWYGRALWQHSSGFLTGQLVALALGAALVFNGPIRSPRVLATKAVVAAGAGVLLAAVNAAVAIPVAAVIVGTAPVRELEYLGWPPGTYLANVLGDPAALRTLAVLLGAFPLYALIGVGLGVLVLWRWVRVPVILLWWVGSCWVSVPVWADRHTAPFWEFLLLPHVAGLTSISLTTFQFFSVYSDHPPLDLHPPPEYAQGGLLLGALGYAVLLNAVAWYVLARRRARTAGADGPT